jgi:hypothetical protein
MERCAACGAAISTGRGVKHGADYYHSGCYSGKMENEARAAMEENPVREDVELKLSEEQRNYLENHFSHHPPTDDRIAKMHEAVREHCKGLAAVFTFLPQVRERSLALTKIEEAMMWANACIARNHEMILKNLDEQETSSNPEA